MWTRRQNEMPFRPAPFPIYPEDTGRLGLERWLNLTRLLGLCILLLAPVFAGPSSELSFPVSYARVELGERAPVLLTLDLPAADYHVSPASLGYFSDTGDFVYGGEVARGLIYGRSGRDVLVVEIAAPERAELYLDRQLNAIRERVADVNRCRNRLRLERGRNLVGESEAAGYLAAVTSQLGPDLDGPLPEDSAPLADGGESTGGPDPAAALEDYARHRARLKELYYAAQSARLQLMLAKFDLQVALARLPQPELEATLVVGDERLVRSTMLKEIDRLAAAWDARSDQLQSQIVGDRDELDDASRHAKRDSPAANLGANSLVSSGFRPKSTAQAGGLADEGADLGAPADGGAAPWIGQSVAGDAIAAQRTELGLLEARLTIAASELTQLNRRINELSEARRHVQSDMLPGWTELPRLAPRLRQLQLKGLEALDAFALVEAEAREPRTAAPLLLSLAQEFERPDAPRNSGPAADWKLAPDEVAYGLLAVDRCRLGDVDQAGDATPPDERSADQLLAALGNMLAFPADYDTATYNLGFLEFIRWYASLDQPAELVDAKTPPEDVPEEEPGQAAEDESSPNQADVDDLFN